MEAESGARSWPGCNGAQLASVISISVLPMEAESGTRSWPVWYLGVVS